jgi:hypothetical protein
VEFLPERVRLVAAPGDLRDVELDVLGWRSEDGETALICRLIDGSSGTIPARWTDLPRRRAVERPLGVIGTPAAWRLLGERLAAVPTRRPEVEAVVHTRPSERGCSRAPPRWKPLLLPVRAAIGSISRALHGVGSWQFSCTGSWDCSGSRSDP